MGKTQSQLRYVPEPTTKTEACAIQGIAYANIELTDLLCPWSCLLDGELTLTGNLELNFHGEFICS